MAVAVAVIVTTRLGIPAGLDFSAERLFFVILLAPVTGLATGPGLPSRQLRGGSGLLERRRFRARSRFSPGPGLKTSPGLAETAPV